MNARWVVLSWDSGDSKKHRSTALPLSLYTPNTAKHCTHTGAVTCPNPPHIFLSFAFMKYYSTPLWPFCRSPTVLNIQPFKVQTHTYSHSVDILLWSLTMLSYWPFSLGTGFEFPLTNWAENILASDCTITFLHHNKLSKVEVQLELVYLCQSVHYIY